MSKYPIVCFLSCFLLMGHMGMSQLDQRTYDLQTVTPPSPDASSLGKYADWPVSLYTGVPDISIPIYTLKGRSLSVPISINYHSSGIKVGEYASCVGLGWSLQAGGVITRSVRGLPDDAGGSEGYLGMRSFYNNPGNLTSGTTIPSYDSLFQVQVVSDNVDSDPDLFMFNALGRSYKFFFSGNGTIVTQPYSNLKITFNTADSSFTVVMEDGTQLLFGGGNFVELTSCIDFATFNYISSWYLRQIISPKGEVINFTYVPSTVQQDGYYFESDYVLDHIAVNVELQSTVKPARTTVQNQSIQALTLSTIESDLGRVEFTTGSRSDLIGALAVTGINVYSKLQNRYLESYAFHYSYAAAAEVSGNSYTLGFTNPGFRMHLDSLSELATDNTPPQVWKFSYIPWNLPAYKSFAQDYWGYYNGQTGNTTLLPSEYQFNPGTYPVGNRSPDSTSMMAEMLTQITYPTGGYSKFSWEPNNYLQYEQMESTVSPNPAPVLDMGPDQTNFSNTYTYTFTIDQPQYFSYSFYGISSADIMGDYPSGTVLASTALTDSSGTRLVSLNYTRADSNIWQTSSSVLLNPGTYTFTMSSISEEEDFVTGSFEDLNATFSYVAPQGYENVENYVGGLRVKSIIYSDNIDTTKNIQKYYQYAGAFLVDPIDPVTDYLSQVTDNTYYCGDGGDDAPCGFPGCLLFSVVYDCRSSATKCGLGSVQGGPVGYSTVTEKLGPNGENGENIYYFTNAGDLNVASSKGLPYPPIVSLDYERGLPAEEDTYTASGALVHKTLNTYQYVGQDTITTWKAAYLYNVLSSCYNVSPLSELILRIYYQDLTNQVQHLSTTDITYNTANGDSVQAATRYDYEDALNMQPTRTAKIDSKGDSIILYSRTALEKATINSSIPLSAKASTAVDSMLARNMVRVPLESERYNGGALTDKIMTNYRVQATGLVLPDNVIVQTRGNPIETRIYFPEYDGYGNLLEQQKSADSRHDYIYAYAGTYPIAQVVNGDSTSIAYTSFETTETGNWIIGSGTVDTTTSITGSKSFSMSGAISRTGLNSGTTYIVSYWTTNSGPMSIGGTNSGYPMQGKTEFIHNNNWTLFVHKVTGQSTITVNGSGHIDELRLYPVTAQMATYTYKPLVGMTSQTDIGNRVTYYEYDGMQRLKRIRDQDYNILKTFDYQYQTPSGCGIGCTILAMETFLGTNTPGYPVGVFDIHGNLVGDATGASSYVSLWNSDTADSRVGTLTAGSDSLHFNLSVNTGQTAPVSVTGCRYYQYDLPWNKLDGVSWNNGSYVDFGDNTGMHLPLTNTIGDTLYLLAPNTTRIGFTDQYNQVYWFIHTYGDTTLKTITLYHNEVAFYTGLDNGTDPATSLTKVENLRGNLPQAVQEIGGSCYQQASALTVANIANWSSISSVTGFWAHCGDGVTPSLNLNYGQDFMANNRNLQLINTTNLYYYQAGYWDSTFKITRLKSNWNTYFTNLQDVEICDAHWNREDLTSLTLLREFCLVPDNQNHSNNPTGNPNIPIPSSVLDNVLNQIAAGAGQNVSNGIIYILSGGSSGRTSASNTAVSLLDSKGWLVYIDNVQQ